MKTKLWGVARVAISVSLIAYLLTLVDLRSVVEQLGGIRIPWVLLAFLLLLFQALLSALRWKVILKSDGLAMPLFYLLRVYLIGGFVSLFLPTSFGGDVYRAYKISRESGNVGKAVTSVIFDRISGFFALTTIAVIGYISLPESSYRGVVLGLYILFIIGFLIASSPHILRFLGGFDSRWVAKTTVPMRSFAAYRKDRRSLARVLLISFVFQFNIVVINKIYCAALDIGIPFWDLLVIIPIIYLTEMLPISINGIGVRDGAFMFFFVMMGFSGEQGLAVAIVVISIRYLFGLIGGALLLLESLKPKTGERMG